MKTKFMYVVLMIATLAFSQQFTEITTGIVGTTNGKSIWGDLDNDGDLDLITAGGYFKIYRNDGAGIFTDTGFESWFMFENADLGDYDNDGYLDILGSGMDGARIFRNNGNWTFLHTFLTGGHSESTAKWGDYNNDGYLDVLLTGYNNASIYRNEGNGVFSDINAGLMGLEYSKAWWVDYDCNGDLDVMLTGDDMAGMTGYKTILYKNEGNGVFTDINAGLQGGHQGWVDWGDYDNDGDPDLLYTGGITAKTYRNDGNNIFTDINAGLQGVGASSAEWGDYDNDGDLDIILTGWVSSGVFFTKLYRNDGSGVFTDINAGLTNVYYGCAVWGDYDNDGDLDIFMNGYDGSNIVAKLYMNNCVTPNTLPLKPTKLATEMAGDSLCFSFSPSTDAETPQAGLTYNIDVTLNGEKYLSGMSDLTNGYRKIVKEGNLNSTKKYSLPGFSNLPQEEKSLSWKVQAIDNCFAGSEFSTSSDLVFPSPRDLSLSNKELMTESDLLKWEYVSPEILDRYVIQIDEDRYFRTPIETTYELAKESETENTEGQKLIYISMALKDFTGYETMVSDSIYFWRIKPVYNDSGKITIFSEVPKSLLYVFTDLTPGFPQNITISKNETDVILNWNAVEVKQKGVTYNVYSSTDPYAEFPAGYTLEQSGITTTSWSEPVSGNKKFYVVTAYYSLQ